MQSRTKRHLTPAALDALLRGSVGLGCRLEHELTDGRFNSAYRVLLDDGRHAVVKLAPPANAGCWDSPPWTQGAAPAAESAGGVGDR